MKNNMRTASAASSRHRTKKCRTNQRQRVQRRRARNSRPAAAYRRRTGEKRLQIFEAHDDWHEPLDRTETELVVQPAGRSHIHAVSAEEVRDRLAQLPRKYASQVEVVQLSRMTKKRALFPRYGMQWGWNVYLYPVEESLTEIYLRPPSPQQQIEARMFGGKWTQEGNLWQLQWTANTIKDFYLNNVLIHEVGHVIDDRNTKHEDRERFANWFAIEYGYRRK